MTVTTIGAGEVRRLVVARSAVPSGTSTRARWSAVRAIAFDGACLRGKCDDDHELGYELMKRFATVILERLQATRVQTARRVWQGAA